MATYKPLQSVVLTSATSSVTFSGIDQSYSDLIFVCNVTGNTGSNGDLSITFNGDTSSGLYSRTVLDGNGTTAVSSRSSNVNFIYLNYNGAINSSNPSNYIVHLNNYSNTTTYKSVLVRSGNPSIAVAATVGLWRNTESITSSTITVSTSFAAGSTFSLYGISPVNAKITSASGGTDIFYDSTYAYHVFKGSGTFTPNRTLSCDYLVVAGGGSGGNNIGGGGGAGGFRIATSQSLTATSYTVTVGAGGGNSASGNTSTFNALATTGGGAGGGANVNGSAGGSGGGGGGATTGSGGAGNSGSYSPVEGYQGGNGNQGAGGGNRSGGGGGAGAVGQNYQTTASGAGGVGAGGASYTNYAIINAMAAATGTGVLSSSHYYYAGGGGGGNQGANINGVGGIGGGGTGGNNTDGISGRTNTGGGGGGGGNDLSNGFSGGNGGSGIVIVRYLK